MTVSWKDISWGSVNMNRLNWRGIEWDGIDYQTFFNILLYCCQDTDSRNITILLSKNDKSLLDFVKDQEAWSRKNKKHELTKALSIVKRYLSQRKKSVNKQAQRNKHKGTRACISYC
jgi:hypothetical protein